MPTIIQLPGAPALQITNAAPGFATNYELADSVYVDVGWTRGVRLAIFRPGTFDATATGGSAEVKDAAVELGAGLAGDG